jgi:hypothetical protein
MAHASTAVKNKTAVEAIAAEKLKTGPKNCPFAINNAQAINKTHINIKDIRQRIFYCALPF